MPEKLGNQKSALRVAFEAMAPGQSVMISRATTLQTIYGTAKAAKIKVSTRQINCESRRIWRVS